MPKRNRECGQCEWYNAIYQEDEVVGGTCHRFPPAVLRDEADESCVLVQFPPVESQSWCGKFRRREE